MKESLFIRQNKEKWATYQRKLGLFGSFKAEELATGYQDVLTDLAYAQTQYPNSRIVYYLNGIAKQMHQQVYKPRYYSFSQFMHLVFYEIPSIVANARRELLFAFVLFMAFVVAGAVLSVQDEAFIRETLGNNYVEMTLRNIANGNPTDVYSSGGMTSSFVSIMLNNLRVTCTMYAYGIIPLLGPISFIKSNGLMLGAFQTLFFLHHVGFQSMTAIWIHGAFEISSLIIAAGAAFTLGKGWVFPGSFSRLQSIRKSGMESVKILSSTIPLFVVAAFFEGFVTRQVQYPLFVKLLFIFGSFSFIVYYYIILPYRVYRQQKQLEI